MTDETSETPLDPSLQAKADEHRADREAEIRAAAEDRFEPANLLTFVDPENVHLSPKSKEHATYALKDLRNRENWDQLVRHAKELLPHLCTDPAYMQVAGARSAQQGCSSQEAIAQIAFEMAFGFATTLKQLNTTHAVDEALKAHDPKKNDDMMEKAIQHAIDNPDPLPSHQARFQQQNSGGLIR